MRPILTFGAAALAAVMLAAAAAGGNGLARERHVAPDMKLARSVLLRASDLGKAWKSERANGKEEQITCGKRWSDESDLVETGEAWSRVFSRSGNGFYVAVFSGTAVFRTEAMANMSWKRAVRPGLPRRLGVFYRSTVSQGGAKATLRAAGEVVSFPKLAPRTAAYRMIYTVPVRGRDVPAVIDVVLLQRGRVQTSLLSVSFGSPLSPSDQSTLASALARRLAKAPLSPNVA
jgi:hypothetical protein